MSREILGRPLNESGKGNLALAAMVLVAGMGLGAISKGTIDFGKDGKKHHRADPGIHLAHPKSPKDVTVDTRASVKTYEKLFGCDIQDMGKQSPPEPTDKQRACIKHIAYVIGDNSYPKWDMDKEFPALDGIFKPESYDWNAKAASPISSARGIPQMMMSYARPEILQRFGTGPASFKKNPVSQVQEGLMYIHDRYGTPTDAYTLREQRCITDEHGCWY